MSVPRALGQAALLAMALALAAGARAQAPAVRLELHADTSRTDPGGVWPVLSVIHNDAPFSLALDSILYAVHPLAGTPQPLRRLPLPDGLWQAAAGDSMLLTARLPASGTDAWVMLRFHVQTHDKRPLVLADSVRVPGRAGTPVPQSRLGRAGKRSIEFWRIPPPSGSSGWGVLMLRDEGVPGDDDVRAAMDLAASGYAVVLLNAPGTGRTQGPADLAGPLYRAAALAALDSLAATPGVKRDRLAVWGAGVGGTLALLLGESRPDLRAVVSQNAIPDLWASYRAGETPWRTAIGAAATRDSAAWRARSPAYGVAKLRCRTLVLHGDRDVRSPSLHVHAFVAALQHAGTPVSSRFVPLLGRTLSAPVALDAARRFLDDAMAGR